MRGTQVNFRDWRDSVYDYYFLPFADKIKDECFFFPFQKLLRRESSIMQEDLKKLIKLIVNYTKV